MFKRLNQLNVRVPMEVDAIQVNFCKNPHCQNFGIPASTTKQPRGRGAAERGRDTYNIVQAEASPCCGAIFAVNIQR